MRSPVNIPTSQTTSTTSPITLAGALSLSLSLHKENGRFFTQFHNYFVLDKIEFCELELAIHKCEFREHFGDGNRDATSEEREESSRIPDTRGLGLPTAGTTAGSGRPHGKGTETTGERLEPVLANQYPKWFFSFT